MKFTNEEPKNQTTKFRGIHIQKNNGSHLDSISTHLSAPFQTVNIPLASIYFNISHVYRVDDFCVFSLLIHLFTSKVCYAYLLLFDTCKYFALKHSFFSLFCKLKNIFVVYFSHSYVSLTFLSN